MRNLKQIIKLLLMLESCVAIFCRIFLIRDSIIVEFHDSSNIIKIFICYIYVNVIYVNDL